MSNRRTTMTLFSGPLDPLSHQVRIVLLEKGITTDIISVNADHPPEDLLDLNPYGTVPMLAERDLALYESYIIMEYLEERYPHPPLLPVYPVARAKARLLMHSMRNNWCTLLDSIFKKSEVTEVESTRRILEETLIGIAPLFNDSPYFMSEEFSLLDCYVLPLLWRLPAAGITLPNSAKSIGRYTERLFARHSFQLSLTDAEKHLR